MHYSHFPSQQGLGGLMNELYRRSDCTSIMGIANNALKNRKVLMRMHKNVNIMPEYTNNRNLYSYMGNENSAKIYII